MARKKRIFREWQHPRDARGRFASGAGSASWADRAEKMFKATLPAKAPASAPGRPRIGRGAKGAALFTAQRAGERGTPVRRNVPASQLRPGDVVRDSSGRMKTMGRIDNSGVASFTDGSYVSPSEKFDMLKPVPRPQVVPKLTTTPAPPVKNLAAFNAPDSQLPARRVDTSRANRQSDGVTSPTTNRGRLAADTKRAAMAPQLSDGQRANYDKLLGNGPGEGTIQNAGARKVVEQLEAHGWGVSAHDPMHHVMRFKAPDGREIGVQFLDAKPGDRMKPRFYTGSEYRGRDLTFKAATAYVVTPTHEPTPGANIDDALRRAGLPELPRKYGMTDTGGDATLGAYIEAGKDLMPAGAYGGRGRDVGKAVASLREAAKRNREIADDRKRYNDQVMGGEGRGYETDVDRLRRERADQYERVADELEKMDREYAAYLVERDRRAALPLDIRPTPRSGKPKAAKKVAAAPKPDELTVLGRQDGTALAERAAARLRGESAPKAEAAPAPAAPGSDTEALKRPGARKGDLAVVERTTVDYLIGQPRKERTEVVVGVVTSTDRNGLITGYSTNVDGSYPSKLMRGERALKLEAERVDVPAAIAAAKAHTYPNSTTPMPFESMDAVKELVKPHLGDQTAKLKAARAAAPKGRDPQRLKVGDRVRIGDGSNAITAEVIGEPETLDSQFGIRGVNVRVKMRVLDGPKAGKEGTHSYKKSDKAQVLPKLEAAPVVPAMAAQMEAAVGPKPRPAPGAAALIEARAAEQAGQLGAMRSARATPEAAPVPGAEGYTGMRRHTLLALARDAGIPMAGRKTNTELGNLLAARDEQVKADRAAKLNPSGVGISPHPEFEAYLKGQSREAMLKQARGYGIDTTGKTDDQIARETAGAYARTQGQIEADKATLAAGGVVRANEGPAAATPHEQTGITGDWKRSAANAAPRPESMSDTYRRNKDITRAEFDALPGAQQDRILGELRKVRDSGEQKSRTIPSNRSSMGMTVHGLVDADHVEGARAKLRELTYVAPPKVDNSPAARAERLKGGDIRAIDGLTIAELADVAGQASMGGFPLSWKRNKIVDYISNQVIAGDRYKQADRTPDGLGNALRGATPQQALALLEALDAEEWGLTIAQMKAAAKSMGVKLPAGDKWRTMRALSNAGRDLAPVPKA